MTSPALETPPGALHFPATARNREPILAVLGRVLPARGLVLEIASGSGEHALHFAAALPGLAWQPSDLEPEHLASIEAWRGHAGTPNLRPAVRLDVCAASWPVTSAGAIVCINMIHIAPWSACEALLRGANAALPAAGVLYLYGPFRRGGLHTAESNERFDERLRAQDPAWGVRNLEDVVERARAHGFVLHEVVPMPANNLSVVLART